MRVVRPHFSPIGVRAPQSPAVKALAVGVGASKHQALGESSCPASEWAGSRLRGWFDVRRSASSTAITVHTQQPVGSRPSRETSRGDTFPDADRLRALLLGATPREVLARIATDDPLRLRPAVVERLRREHQLLDAGRVHLRCLALCAREACRYLGTPPLKEWLSARVDEAVQQVLDEDPGEDPDDGAWTPLAEPLGLDPADARASCSVFNHLPLDQRRAFFRLVIEREDPQQVAAELGLELAEMLRFARSALECLIRAQYPDEEGGS